MIAWLRRTRQTHTPVHDENALARERDSGLRLAYQALGAVQITLQLLLWLVMAAYDQTTQATWQAALMQAVPVAGLWLIWRNAALPERPAQTNGPSPSAWVAAALLLPCLFLDSYLLLRSAHALLTKLIPVFPDWLRVGIVTVFPLLTVWLGKGKGVAYGAYFMRFYLPVLFCLSTVLSGADIDASRLWPLWGSGLGPTALTALGGAGACWGVALLFLFPLEGRRGNLRDSRGTALCLWLPVALCVLWALWMGLVTPWRAGDAPTPGYRMTALSRYSRSMLLNEAGVLFWISMIPLGLAGTVGGGERLLRGVLPGLPRFWAALFSMLPGVAGLCLLPTHPPELLLALLPWRSLLSALCGVALLMLGRRGR